MTIRVGAAIVVLLLAGACGQPSSVASVSSPRASKSQSSPSPSTLPSPSSSPPFAGPATALVIQDYTHNQVRLARFDAVDLVAVTGYYDGLVDGKVIVVEGLSLLAVAEDGQVTSLGRLAGTPEASGPGTVAVNPTLTQWIYTLTDSSWTSQVHLGSPGADRVIATIPSPDGDRYYRPFTWNSSGAYMVKQATGLGGVGPFLEYDFPVAKIDTSAGTVTDVAPECVVLHVLDDGTLLCRTATGGLEVRPPSEASHVIQVATSTSGGGNGVYSRLVVSPDQQRFVASRNGNSNPDLVNFQIVTGSIGGSTASVFGQLDFYPDVWLPDGRVVADHLCWTFQQNGGPCDASLDGTYFVSADGKTRSLFYKIAGYASVVGYV